MFSAPLWGWFWAIAFILSLVAIVRSSRRADWVTLRLSVVSGVGAACLALAHWLPSASTILTGVGIICLLVSNIDALFFSKPRAT